MGRRAYCAEPITEFHEIALQRLANAAGHLPDTGDSRG
jgi:hypothetical protein